MKQAYLAPNTSFSVLNCSCCGFVSQEILVNLDPVVLEVLQETRWMTKLGVTVPAVVLKMATREAQLKSLRSR